MENKKHFIEFVKNFEKIIFNCEYKFDFFEESKDLDYNFEKTKFQYKKNIDNVEYELTISLNRYLNRDTTHCFFYLYKNKEYFNLDSYLEKHPELENFFLKIDDTVDQKKYFEYFFEKLELAINSYLKPVLLDGIFEDQSDEAIKSFYEYLEPYEMQLEIIKEENDRREKERLSKFKIIK